MAWQHFTNLSVPPPRDTVRKRRYSVTADILAYERCSLQYGAFAVRRYEPALAVQLFYGHVVHQVLDRAHAHYRGLVGSASPGTLPTDTDIESYFLAVENTLRARGIRAARHVRESALDILKKFNSIEGPALYPRVLDTECRLQADQGSFILHGNVDVLAVAPGTLEDVEIWDYKGSKRPDIRHSSYQQYVFQMQVYAELYRRRTGNLPQRAILYFLNELQGPGVRGRPRNAVMEVPLNNLAVDSAMASFRQTVDAIESCRNSGAWPQPQRDPSEETCDACDLRWNCPATRNFGRSYDLIHP